jgi:RNA polymerase sigma-70 factor (ECF subfamily)
MPVPPSEPSSLQQCLNRLRAGEPSARDDLLRATQDRLRLLTRKMMSKFRRVRRWEDTDDVVQNVLLRLTGMLAKVPVASSLDFLRLASAHIRWELINLARGHFGPEGVGANHATPDGRTVTQPGREEGAASSDDPANLAAWADLHERIGLLPGEERDVFDLHWYQGLTHEEVAGLLGVSVSTVRRRWQAARVRLMEAFDGEPPF